MKNTAEYAGYWWLPTNPDKQVSGILHIDRYNGIELKTINSLLSRQEVFGSNFIKSQEIILGKTIEDKFITLIDSHCSNYKSGSDPESSTSTHKVKFAVVGEREFRNKSDITFTSAEVRFSLLDEWLGVKPFKFIDSIDSSDFSSRNSKKLTLEYESPETIEFYIDFISAQFYTNYAWSKNISGNLKYEITHSSYLRLTPDQPQSLDWYMKQFYSLQKLLTVMTGFPVSPIELRGYGNDILIHKNTTTKEEFEIYGDIHKNFQNLIEKHPNDLLFTVPKFGTELSVVVNNWFQKTDILDPATNLHIATISSSSLYTEFKLLNYAQALEALHRRVFDGKYILDQDYEPIRETLVNSILKNVDRDHRNALKAKIKYGNEFSQRKRIRLLLDDVWENCLYEFITDKKEFINNVVDTRNYLVHFDQNSITKVVLDSTGMFHLAERLKIILITHILIQLDIPRENIYRTIKNFSAFEFLRCRV